MYEKKAVKHRMLAIVMTLAMMLSLSVCAFAQDAETYNNSETYITLNVTTSPSNYIVTVVAPFNTTKIEVEATLYQKQLIGRKEISTMTGSADYWKYTKVQSADIQLGKTYILEATARVCTGGVWDTIDATVTAKT